MQRRFRMGISAVKPPDAAEHQQQDHAGNREQQDEGRAFRWHP
jgi:hypothetical protein